MTTPKLQPSDIRERATLFAVVGLFTTGALWLYIALAESPTASNHLPGSTYIPDGLYLATVISLIVAFIITVGTDLILGQPSWSFFLAGFAVGFIMVVLNVPWTNLDNGGGQMFSVAIWWLPPLMGSLFYVARGVYQEFK